MRLEASVLIGVDESTVRLWEIGECEPVASNLLRVARAYRVTLYDLMEIA